eukprot:gene611-1038_t
MRTGDFVLLVGVVLHASLCVVHALDATTSANWTILVYGSGGNDLEAFLQEDMREMAEGLGSSRDVNVVVLADRSRRQDNLASEEWSSTKEILVANGSFIELQDFGTLDMMQKSTLTDFVVRGFTNFPAKRTFLILWNHRPGWVGQVSAELFALAFYSVETSALKMRRRFSNPASVASNNPVNFTFGGDEHVASMRDVMPLVDIRDAVKDALARLEVDKLDLLGFDAGLMQSYSVLAALIETTSHFVASEDLVPGHGWDYTAALRLLVEDSASLSPVDLGRALEETFGASEQRPLTLATVKAQAFQSFAVSFARLLETMQTQLSRIPFGSSVDLLKAILRARSSEAMAVLNLGSDLASLVDLGAFLREVNTDLAGVADIQPFVLATLQDYREMVVSYTRPPESPGYTGVSIYFPKTRDEFDTLNAKSGSSFDQVEGSWIEDAYGSTWPGYYRLEGRVNSDMLVGHEIMLGYSTDQGEVLMHSAVQAAAVISQGEAIVTGESDGIVVALRGVVQGEPVTAPVFSRYKQTRTNGSLILSYAGVVDGEVRENSHDSDPVTDYDSYRSDSDTDANTALIGWFCGLYDEVKERADCGAEACGAYYWQAGAYGRCNATCGGGMQRRSVTCMARNETGSHQSLCEPAAEPASRQQCNTGGFSGVFCERLEAKCAGVLMSTGECCDSGVLDVGGACCAAMEGKGGPGVITDQHGACCAAGVLDVCGVCNGTAKPPHHSCISAVLPSAHAPQSPHPGPGPWIILGLPVVDILGACCETLDASSVCCMTGALDECGVCNGDDSSCATSASTLLAVADAVDLTNSSSAIYAEFTSNFSQSIAAELGIHERRVQMEYMVTFDVAPPVSGDDPVVTMSSLSEAIANTPSLGSIQSANRAAVCGNDVCEFGEGCDDVDDIHSDGNQEQDSRVDLVNILVGVLGALFFISIEIYYCYRCRRKKMKKNKNARRQSSDERTTLFPMIFNTTSKLFTNCLSMMMPTTTDFDEVDGDSLEKTITEVGTEYFNVEGIQGPSYMNDVRDISDSAV